MKIEKTVLLYQRPVIHKATKSTLIYGLIEAIIVKLNLSYLFFLYSSLLILVAALPQWPQSLN